MQLRKSLLAILLVLAMLFTSCLWAAPSQADVLLPANQTVKMVNGYAQQPSVPTMFTSTRDVQYSGSGEVWFSSNQDGTGDIGAHDVLQIEVNGVLQIDYTYSEYDHCNPAMNYGSPIDLTQAFVQGTNHVVVRDIVKCNVIQSTDMYLAFKNSSPTQPSPAMPIPAPSVVAAPGCAGVQFVGVRGSGETASDSQGFGQTIAAVKAGVETRIPGVKSAAIDYPAIPVDLKNLDYGSAYEISMAAGRDALDAYLTKFIQDCPKSYVILAGYSQGAHVVGDEFEYLTTNEKEHIAAVVLMADPRFNPEQYGNVNAGFYDDNLSGAYQMVIPEQRIVQAPWFSRFKSYCMLGDPVCNFSTTNAELCGVVVSIGLCIHQLYPQSIWPGRAAKWAARQLASLPPLK